MEVGQGGGGGCGGRIDSALNNVKHKLDNDRSSLANGNSFISPFGLRKESDQVTHIPATTQRGPTEENWKIHA